MDIKKDIYKQYVDQIFDLFREMELQPGQGKSLLKVRGLLAKETSKERFNKLYLTMRNLIYTNYLAMSPFDPSLILLTERGERYMEGKEPLELNVELDLHVDVGNVSVNEAFIRLWDIIGDNQKALFYLDGSTFYEVAQKYIADLPTNYTGYIDIRTSKNQDLSRESWYSELLTRIDSKKRVAFLHDLSLKIKDIYQVDELTTA